MVKLTARQVVGDAPVLPVLVVHELAHAVPLARALVAGGLRMLEVTLRTPVALDAIRAMAHAVPEAVVGAGTVLTPADAQAAAQAGARFAVSPGLRPALHQACRDLGLAWLPGVATASEVMQGLEAGLDTFKLFPAVPIGGVALLQAWAGPLPGAVYCPTGGITAAHARDFLALPQVACVGGSWLAPAQAMAQGQWAAIEGHARAAAAWPRAWR